jgi:hypothetical protein
LSALHAAAAAPARTPYRFTIALANCFAQLSPRVLPGKELSLFSAGQVFKERREKKDGEKL